MTLEHLRPRLAENWLPMPDCPGYEVSYRGDVRSLKVGRLLTNRTDDKGRAIVGLCVKGKSKNVVIGRMVLRAFGGEPPTPKHVAAHNDGDPQHNHIDNLRWATYAENNADMAIHGTKREGEGHSRAKLTKAIILEMARLYRDGTNQPDIARRYSVNVCTVNRALRGRSYKSLAIAAAMHWETP